MGIVVEPSPSTQVPYGLRNTLGCLVAWTAIPNFIKLVKAILRLFLEYLAEQKELNKDVKTYKEDTDENEE